MVEQEYARIESCFSLVDFIVGQYLVVLEKLGEQLQDLEESMVDTSLSGMLDIYLSSSSNKMNEIMKILTIIATIFIPLTFIAGVYGMNFRQMPELEWRWGYLAVLCIMIIVSVVMLLYFRKKKCF